MGYSTRKQQKVVDIIHIIEIVLIHGVLGISVYRRFNKNIIRSRADFLSLSAAAKSLIFIFWILATEHVSFMKKRYSRKANMVLMIIDSVFWGAVIGMTAYFLIQNGCVGIGCKLTYAILALSSVLFVLSIPVALLSTKFWLASRRTGMDAKEQEDVISKPDQYLLSPQELQAASNPVEISYLSPRPDVRQHPITNQRSWA